MRPSGFARGMRILLGILVALTIVAIAPAQGQTRADAEKPFDLAAFLKTAADYCRRLESAALYYTCREEIEEAVNLTRDIRGRPILTDQPTLGSPTSPETNGRRSLVYDYQCIRTFNGAIRDSRTLIEENGKKKHVPEARLDRTIFDFGTTLLGPVGIFAAMYQDEYDYSIADRDRFESKSVVIVMAKPKPGAPPSRSLFGKAWVDPETNEILKIEWDESRIGRYEIFREWGARYQLTPRITITSEFSTEKNGLRFPTRMFFEEAYLNEQGRKGVRSVTSVKYSDFKFFTVEVEIK